MEPWSETFERIRPTRGGLKGAKGKVGGSNLGKGVSQKMGPNYYIYIHIYIYISNDVIFFERTLGTLVVL